MLHIHDGVVLDHKKSIIPTFVTNNGILASAAHLLSWNTIEKTSMATAHKMNVTEDHYAKRNEPREKKNIQHTFPLICQS